MKKIFLLIYFLSASLLILGQTGDGSSGNPFYGTISTDVQWSTGDPNYGSTVYIGTVSNPDLIVGTGGHLTIDPGITVIFTQLTSDLLITGSGVLTAEGTSSDQILFTKDSGKSHWGHISFETPGSGTPITGTGSFDYCIIEYGYAVTSGTYPSNAGGGIQVNADDVTIENCLFENNYSNFGGAVTVNAGKNTEIKYSVFKSNTSNQAGGALLLWTSSTAKVENCIFEENNSLSNGGTSYGGGAIWLLNNTSTIVNCTFVNNTATDPGDGIFSYSSSGSRIINSILWGSNEQFAGASTTSTIVTCAFESAKPANAGNSIIISDVASDHFVDAGSSDWTLKFISPCRDAGVNSYTGVTIPSTDYNGNPRIGTKDIGTYEVQYSRWTGTTSTAWATATNWDQSVDPSSGTGDVIIPYVTTAFPDATAITVDADIFLILEPRAQLTVEDLENNGTIRLRSDGTGTASLIITGNHDNYGEEIAELYLTGGAGTAKPYNYHYISIPFEDHTVDSITNYTDNLLEYNNYTVVDDMSQGWQYWDDYSPYNLGDPFDILTLGRGYNVYHSSAGRTFSFSDGGTFNTGAVEIPLNYDDCTGDPDPDLHGRNLVGNPFTSSIDWDLIAPDLELEISNAIVFTSGSLGYVYYLYPVGGSTSGVTSIIPPMQGFFMYTTATGGTSVIIDPSAQVHNNSQARYKGAASSDFPLLRMKISDGTNSDYTLLWMNEKATLDSDMKFDAAKFFEDRLTIWSSLSGKNFAINGIPYPAESQLIPLAVNIKNSGTFKISSETIQKLDDYNITLIDNNLGSSINLKEIPEYTFTSGAGTITDRFVIQFSNIATSAGDIPISYKLFNIYAFNGKINILPLSDQINNIEGALKIYDLTGRIVSQLSRIELNKGELKQVEANFNKGIYFVEVTAGKMRFVGKVVLH